MLLATIRFLRTVSTRTALNYFLHNKSLLIHANGHDEIVNLSCASATLSTGHQAVQGSE